jgi:hypothetical protein
MAAKPTSVRSRARRVTRSQVALTVVLGFALLALTQSGSNLTNAHAAMQRVARATWRADIKNLSLPGRGCEDVPVAVEFRDGGPL